MVDLIARRAFLRRGGLACASLLPLNYASALSRVCETADIERARHSELFNGSKISASPTIRNLAPVDVDHHLELRTIVGLRPYRPSGFVVRAEKLDETLVVHNYGHGGAGITLSWGTAQLAMQLGRDGHTGPVAVLGSGAVGLSTARLLQESGFCVNIYTQALPPDTTSNVAGGEWRSFLVADPQKIDAGFSLQLQSASNYAYKRFQSMLGLQYGIRWITSYSISKHSLSETISSGAECVTGYVGPAAQELQAAQTPFPTCRPVRQLDTLLIEPPRYLAAMMDAFLEAGGKVIIRSIEDRAAIARLQEKLVFNCTGMGAKELFGDDELTPVRGQLTFLKPQPDVDYAVAHDELYMLPRSDGILLGGTYELGIHSVAPNNDKKREILARHKSFFDSYRKIV
jgi:D-amino-acid oxidase